MRGAGQVAYLLVSAVLALLPEGRAADDLKELNRRASQSVVLLRMFDAGGQETGTGSGFAVAPGLLVTNHHVVEGAVRIEAVMTGREQLSVSGIVASDRDNDLALLRIEGSSLPPLPLATGTGVEPGERVVVLGHPLGLSGTLSEGIVSAVLGDGLRIDGRQASSQPLLQITAAISPGSSGSPVMNHNGEVIGVVVSLITIGQNLNFAVPAAAVSTLIAGANPRQLERKLGSGTTASVRTYAGNLLISVLFFVAIYLGFRFMRER